MTKGQIELLNHHNIIKPKVIVALRLPDHYSLIKRLELLQLCNSVIIACIVAILLIGDYIDSGEICISTKSDAEINYAKYRAVMINGCKSRYGLGKILLLILVLKNEAIFNDYIAAFLPR